MAAKEAAQGPKLEKMRQKGGGFFFFFLLPLLEKGFFKKNYFKDGNRGNRCILDTNNVQLVRN